MRTITEEDYQKFISERNQSWENFQKLKAENSRLRELVLRGSKMHLGHTIRQEEKFYLDCGEEVKRWEK